MDEQLISDALQRTLLVGGGGGNLSSGLQAPKDSTSGGAGVEVEIGEALDLIGGLGRRNIEQYVVSGLVWFAYTVHAISPAFIDRNCDDYPVDTSLSCAFGLVEERKWISDLISSAFFFGWFLGAPLFGALADRHGRKPATLWSLTLMNASALLLAAAPDEWVALAANTVLGVAVGGCNVVPFTLGVEYLPASRARQLTAYFQLWFSICVVLAPFMAWPVDALLSRPEAGGEEPAARQLARWRATQLVFVVPGLVMNALWWPLARESPRWLLVSRPDPSAAAAALDEIAAANGAPASALRDVVLRSAQKEGGGGAADAPSDLFCASVLRGRTLAMIAAWFAVSFSYYGLVLNRENVSVDWLGPNSFYWNAAIFGLVELPAICITSPALETRFGRKGGTMAFFVAIAVACGLVLVVPKDGAGPILISLVGVFAAKGTFTAVYVWAAECYPTSVRNSAMGVVSASARLGGVTAPWGVTLGGAVEGLDALVLFSATAALAGLLCFFLIPETKGAPIPDTIAQLQQSLRLRDARTRARRAEQREIAAGDAPVPLSDAPPGASPDVPTAAVTLGVAGLGIGALGSCLCLCLFLCLLSLLL
eukprot:SAG11_NODE_3758_length_2248_cov_2.668683_1_plen_594_part_10